MKLIYTPENGSPREWTFKPRRLLNVEAEEIERRTSMTFAEWTNALQSGSMLAVHALLFVLLRRDQPRLGWEQVQFCDEDVDITYELDEKIVLRDGLKATLDAMEPEQAAQARNVIAQLDSEIGDEQPAAAESEDPEAPKAEQPSETSGGLSSPLSSTSILATSTA